MKYGKQNKPDGFEFSEKGWAWDDPQDEAVRVMYGRRSAQGNHEVVLLEDGAPIVKEFKHFCLEEYK